VSLPFAFAKPSPYLHSHTPPHLKNIVAECGAFPALLLQQKLCASHRGASARGERLWIFSLIFAKMSSSFV